MSRRPLRALAVTALRAALLMAVVRTFLSITLLLCLSGQALSQTLPTIAVKMIDSVDSNQDPPGKQYRAGLVRPVNIGNGVIVAQGSPATVTLAKNGSTWNIQLSSLLIRDQVTPVTSNPGTVIGAAGQALGANAANAANAILGQFGRKPPAYSPAGVILTGEHVVMIAGITVSFELNAIPVVAEPSPISPPAPAPTTAATTHATSAPTPTPVAPAAQSASAQRGKWWYCEGRSNDSYYITSPFRFGDSTSAVLTTADINNDAAIKLAWGYFITKQYGKDLGAGCMMGGFDLAGTQKFHDHMRASQKGKIIDIDWKYVPGRDQPPEVPNNGPLFYRSAYFGPNGGDTLVFSDSFVLPSGMELNPVRDDFVRFVKEKYSLQSLSGGCGHGDKAKEASDMKSRYKSIESGWKPTTFVRAQPH